MTEIPKTRNGESENPIEGRWYRVALYAILLLSAAVYLPSIDGLALWDDRALIGAYRSLRQCFDAPFLQHYFRPLVSITFFLEWRAWGRDAFYCHGDNLLIHMATTGALVGLLRALFPNRWLAALGGLLFAVQPAQVSAVAWIGGRTDSLCTLWLTLFLWTLVLSAKSPDKRSWLWTALSVLLFELALLTKEQALAALPIVPAVHLLLERYPANRPKQPTPECEPGPKVLPANSNFSPPNREAPPIEHPPVLGGRWAKRSVTDCVTHENPPELGGRGAITREGREVKTGDGTWEKPELIAFRCLPHLAAALVFIALWMLHYPDPRLPQQVPIADQALLAGHAAAYFGLLFVAPSPRWMHTLTLTQIDRLGWWPAAAGFALLALLLLLLARWRRTSPAAAILLLYALLAYVPVSNLVPMPSLYAAPYRVGILGPAIAGLMAYGICRLAALRPVAVPQLGRAAAVLAGAAFAAWCASLTLADNASWMSQQILFGVFHRDDPGNIPTTCQYSRELVAVHRSPEAVAMLEKMLDDLFGSRGWQDPRSCSVQLHDNAELRRRLRLQYGSSDPIARRLGGVLGDLANARWGAGDAGGARVALSSAFAVDRSNPYANLVAARIAYAGKDYRSALAAMRLSLSVQSERYESRAVLLQTLLALREWREAETECEACIALEPWRVETYRQLAAIRSMLGDRPGAQQALRQSLRDAEGDHIEERRALAEMGRVIAAQSK